MRKIKDILRLRHEAGLSYRGISEALNIGYGTVVEYLNLNSAVEGSSSGAIELESRQFCG